MNVLFSLNLSILTAALLIGSILLGVHVFSSARASFLGLFVDGGFLFLCSIVVVQMLAGWLNVLNIVGVSVIGYVWAIFMILTSWPSYARFSKFPKRPSIYWILLAPLGIFLLIELFNALILPVWEYDSVSYHLPMVAYWFLHHTLRDTFFAVYAGPVGYYPGTGELFTLWPLTLIKTDAVANVQNICLCLLFAITSLQLTRLFKIPDRCGVLFPFLFLSSPIILKEIGTAHVDLFYALTFLFGILFLSEFALKGDQSSLVAFSLSFGLFLGSKYLAIPAALLLAAIAAIVIFRNGSKEGWSKLFPTLLIGLIGFLLTGGLWYFRNILLTGNPIFPAALNIGHWNIWQGYGSMTDQLFSASLLHKLPSLSWHDINQLSHLFIRRTGYQTLLEIAVWLGYVTSLIFFLVWKRWRTFSWPDLFLFLSLPIFLSLYVAAPNSYTDLDANIRYSVLFFLSGALLVAYVANRHRWIWSFLIVAATVVVIVTVWKVLHLSDLPHEVGTLRLIRSYEYLFVPFALRVGIITTFISMAIFLSWNSRRRRLHILLSILIAPTLFFLGNGSIFAVREERQWISLQEKYPALSPLINAFSWIEKNTLPNDRIAFSGFHFNYPLYGMRLDRDVRYVSVNDCLNCNYVDFRDDNEGVFARASREQWLRNLQSENISYLVLFNEFGYMKYEPSWVKDSSGFFEEAFNQANVVVYKLHPDVLSVAR